MQSLLWVWYDTVSWATGKAFSLQNVLQLSQCLDWGPSSNSGNVCRLNENADELCVCVYDCNEVTKYSAQMLPVFPLNAATSRKVGKLSTMSCSSFTALPPHSAMTLTKLPPNLCAVGHNTYNLQRNLTAQLLSATWWWSYKASHTYNHFTAIIQVNLC